MKVGVWDIKADEWPSVVSNGFTGGISSTEII